MATLLLESVRALNLASRFASGYLDSAASAAGRAPPPMLWAEVYFPIMVGLAAIPPWAKALR